MIELDSLDGIVNIISGNIESDFLTQQQQSRPQQQQPQPQQQQQQQQQQHRPAVAEALATPTTDRRNLGAPTSSCPTCPATSTVSPMSRRRSDNLLTCMLITANVGTIFEESALLELWFQQLKSYLIKIKPQLVAIHCQEVGGKNYESSMKNVSNFTDKILGDESIIGDYSRVRIFLDENFKNLEKFTALGSLYLIHDSVRDVKLYNFKTASYELVEGRIVFAGRADETNNVESSCDSVRREPTAPITSQSDPFAKTTTTTGSSFDHVEKIKFPQELFPECRWSRKGFMRTRWLFDDCQPLDLVNIHLFHDASNLIAMEKTPSPYAQNRQRALAYALQRLSEPLKGLDNSRPAQAGHQQHQVPLFIFGDFNFRLNTHKVIQRITEGIPPVVKRKAESDEVLEIVYRKNSNSSKPERNESAAAANTNHYLSIEGTNTTHQDDEKSNLSQGINFKSGKQQDDGNCNYLDGDGIVMTVGKKLFDCENLDEMFRATKNTEWLLELDEELDSFKSQLHEFKISFSPSYPFKEDASGGYSYMKTRCPAWCDRILFNAAGNRLIHCRGVDTANMDGEKKIELLQKQGDVMYRLIGSSVPMGDHKPVLLYCQLNMGQCLA